MTDLYVNGIVVTGGKIPSAAVLRSYLPDEYFLAAADSGYDNAIELGLSPDVVIGDFDSISSETGKNQKILRYPRDKDFTDTELAARHLVHIGKRYHMLIGGGEGRLDHIISILDAYSSDIFPELWITAEETVYAIMGEAEILLDNPGRTVSMFNPGSKSVSVTTQGLHWELDGYTLERGKSSISNRNMSRKLQVTCSSGIPVLLSVSHVSP